MGQSLGDVLQSISLRLNNLEAIVAGLQEGRAPEPVLHGFEEEEEVDPDAERVAELIGRLSGDTTKVRRVYNFGESILRLPTRDDGWLVIRKDRSTNEVLQCDFVNEQGDIVESVDRDLWKHIHSGEIRYIPRRPTGSDPDPKADDVVMNDDR